MSVRVGEKTPTRVVICGAAGRDFHNFNVAFRNDPATTVVAFTATQIPGIEDRRYPAALAGPAYPDGIPILPEGELDRVCREERIDRVVFAYSDVSHGELMHVASRVLASGADFSLLGPRTTMLASRLPVIAISAVRTGCGKSQTARYLSVRLRTAGQRVAVLRHPMPYGDLLHQAVQRFATLADLSAAHCTIEEREEYEPHVRAGNVVFAGVDYERVLAAAEREADVILWDGGNNDFPFLKPDLHIVVVDALRPDQLDTHHPGEAVLHMADLVLINKVDAAEPAAVAALSARLRTIVGEKPIVAAASPVIIESPDKLARRRVLIVEDGPTITHGGMPHGAGYIAVSKLADVTIVDPRASAAPAIAEIYRRYPHIGPVLPAMGYNDRQLDALRATINGSGADVVLAATPIDLAAIGGIERPVVRARYEYADAGEPRLWPLVERFLEDPPS
jgi:predicted GTPase